MQTAKQIEDRVAKIEAHIDALSVAQQNAQDAGDEANVWNFGRDLSNARWDLKVALAELDDALDREQGPATLGSCGCTDYHMADCSMGGAR